MTLPTRELQALLAALESDGRAGGAVHVSLLDCARALERFLGEEPPAIGVSGPLLCMDRRQLLHLLRKASGVSRRRA